MILWITVGFIVSVANEIIRYRESNKEYTIALSNIAWFVIFTLLGPIIAVIALLQKVSNMNDKVIIKLNKENK